MGCVGSSLRIPAHGAHEKAKTGARPAASVRRERPGGGRSCSLEAEEGRVGRQVPPPSPEAGPGHPAPCAPGYATTLCRCWHRAGNIGERHRTLSMHAPPTPHGTDPFVSLSSTPICLYVPHWVRCARPRWGPSGGRRIGAARARGSREEKIMNEMHAVLQLPRPPCPGNLRAGAARAGTPSGVGGRGLQRSGSGTRGPRSRPAWALGAAGAPAPRPPAPRALRNSRGEAPGRPGAGRSRGWGVPSRPGGCAGDSAAQAHLVGRPG